MTTDETSLEFLQTLRRELIIAGLGVKAIIRMNDEFIRIANYDNKYVDFMLDQRTYWCRLADLSDKDVTLIEQEIEREKVQQYNVPMDVRLMLLLGHM